MTEYLDELIHLFRNARPGNFVRFQNEELRNRLQIGLSFEVLGEIEGYLDLMAEEIAQKYDLKHSQREALGMT